MKKFFLLFTIVFSFNQLFSQTIDWVKYNTGNSGIAGNYVSCILVDNQNRKWFGTKTGVSMFDGENWITYNTANSGLVYDYVQAIAQDSSGAMWFGTNNHGLSQFDGENWTTHDLSLGVSEGLAPDHNNITSLVVSSDNKIWASTYNGVGIFDQNNWSYLQRITDPNWLAFGDLNRFTSCAIGLDGEIWFGHWFSSFYTGMTGISVLMGSEWKNFTTQNTILKSDYIHDITVDKTGKVWFATGYSSGDLGGFVMYDSGNWFVYNEEDMGSNEPPFLKSVAADTSASLWLLTERLFDYWGTRTHYSALIKYDGTNWNYVIKDSVAINFTKIRFDKKNKLWIGTIHDGAWQLNYTEPNPPEPDEPEPTTTLIHQNFPNPANEITNFNFSLLYDSGVNLSIYNAIGQNVGVLADGYKKAGNYTAQWDVSDVPSGIYFYKFDANGYHKIGKCCILK